MIGIRLDAGESVGMGHMARCLPLALSLRALGEDIRFYCRDHPYVRETLHDHGIKLAVVPPLDLPNEAEWMSRAADRDGLSLLLLDSYRLSDAYIDRLNAPDRIIACMDDDALYTYSCDIVINPHPFAAQLSIQTGAKKPAMLLGSQYWVLREEFKHIKPITVRERVERILVLMGAADVNDYMPTALEALRDIDADITAVLGPMAKVTERLTNALDGNPRIRVVRNPPSMAALMSRCDMAISAGGNTVYELLYMGVPSIIVPQSRNERVKAGYLAAEGGIVLPGDYQQSGAKSLNRCVCYMIESMDGRAELSARTRHTITADGADRLAEALIDSILTA